VLVSEVPNAEQPPRPEPNDGADGGLAGSRPWRPPPVSPRGGVSGADPWAPYGPEHQDPPDYQGPQQYQGPRDYRSPAEHQVRPEHRDPPERQVRPEHHGLPEHRSRSEHQGLPEYQGPPAYQGVPDDTADDMTAATTRPVRPGQDAPSPAPMPERPSVPARSPADPYPPSAGLVPPAGGEVSPADQVHQPRTAPVADDPLFPGEVPSWQPRIIPSPPPPRGRFLRGLLVGVLAGVLVFGAGGFFAGRWTANSSQVTPSGPPGPGSPAPNIPAAFPPYEQSQLSLNQAKFTGDLAALAEPWLPWMSGCRRSGDRDGPRLNPGEAIRVACEFGSIALNFVEYKSIVERDKTRIRHLAENVDARELTPGVTAGTDRKTTPSGRSEGGYIEYAYRANEPGPQRTVCGLWWDVADKPVAAYLLTFWKEGLGASWEPLRDVWGRHA
jgi:hypothetical protein